MNVHAAGTYTATKAGVSATHPLGLDVNAVISSLSRGSAYEHDAARRDEKLAESLASMRARMLRASAQEFAGGRSVMASFIAREERERDCSRVLVCVDMDAFFAAVAERDDPSLKGKAFAVGSLSMISTASYEARRYCVRSAMPGFIAKALCPGLVFVDSDFDAYRDAAEAARRVFARYDPNFISGGLDEAFLDMTAELLRRRSLVDSSGDEPAGAAESAGGDVDALVDEFRRAVTAETRGLTCSAGIAANVLLAKVASNEKKPNGQYRVVANAESARAFMATKSVRVLPGVGKVSEAELSALGILTCADIVSRAGDLYVAFGEARAKSLVSASLGCGSTRLERGEEPRKSLSSETTFASTHDAGKLSEIVRELASVVAAGLREEQLCSSLLILRCKSSDFVRTSRSVTLSPPTNSTSAIAAAALGLLKKRPSHVASLRLVGVCASGLSEERCANAGLDKYFKNGGPISVSGAGTGGAGAASTEVIELLLDTDEDEDDKDDGVENDGIFDTSQPVGDTADEEMYDMTQPDAAGAEPEPEGDAAGAEVIDLTDLPSSPAAPPALTFKRGTLDAYLTHK